MKRTAFCLTAVFIGAVALGAAPTSTPDWDARSAAQYLDARMDLWWKNAKVLKTGDEQARCVSCHTAVPYALARPALRRMLGEAALTADERRIIDTVKMRVEFTDRKQPFYDNTEDKKIESRGVEAVVNAVVLANRDAESHAATMSADTAAAMAELWKAQRPDGAWNWLNFGLEPYEAPDAVYHGAALAAMAVGAVPQVTADAAARIGSERLQRYLQTNLPSQRLFNAAWVLLADARLKNTLTADQRRTIVATLREHQRADGGWSLSDLGTWRWAGTEAPFNPPGQTDAALLNASDGYATGLVVYAMRQADVAANDSAMTRGRAWLLGHQQQGAVDDASWAPWRAHSLNFDREHGGAKGEPWRRMFMSDLATAFAVLALTS